MYPLRLKTGVSRLLEPLSRTFIPHRGIMSEPQHSTSALRHGRRFQATYCLLWKARTTHVVQTHSDGIAGRVWAIPQHRSRQPLPFKTTTPPLPCRPPESFVACVAFGNCDRNPVSKVQVCSTLIPPSTSGQDQPTKSGPSHYEIDSGRLANRRLPSSTNRYILSRCQEGGLPPLPL